MSQHLEFAYLETACPWEKITRTIFDSQDQHLARTKGKEQMFQQNNAWYFQDSFTQMRKTTAVPMWWLQHAFCVACLKVRLSANSLRHEVRSSNMVDSFLEPDDFNLCFFFFNIKEIETTVL